MQRKDFKLNEPYREIIAADKEKEFDNDFLANVGITLASLADQNKDDRYVWVYDLEGKILGILTFLDMESYFYMDMVANNRLWQNLCDELKPGFSLFKTLEDLSPIFGYSKIRLDSVSYRVDYWKSHGYEVVGMPQFKEKWGNLYPMEKKLY